MITVLCEQKRRELHRRRGGKVYDVLNLKIQYAYIPEIKMYTTVAPQKSETILLDRQSLRFSIAKASSSRTVLPLLSPCVTQQLPYTSITRFPSTAPIYYEPIWLPDYLLQSSFSYVI
jgi:hypothetical protein